MVTQNAAAAKLSFWPKANAGAGTVANWSGTAIAFSAAFSWVAKHVRWLGQLNWAEAIFVGVGATCILAVAFSLMLIAIRIFRPIGLEAPAQEPLLATGIQPYDDSKLRADFASLKSSYLAVIDDYQRMSALEPKLDTLIRDFKGLPDKAENTRAHTEHAHSLIKQLSIKLEEEANKRALSFHGLKTAELLCDLEERLTAGAVALYHRISNGECLDEVEWKQWEDLFRRWHSDLKVWANTARWCAYNVQDRTLKVVPEDFDGEWTIRDDQFPSADAQRKFKFYRLLLRNWEGIREDVKAGLDGMTYYGMDDKDVQRASAAKLGIHTV